jgi:hypothetical protein
MSKNKNGSKLIPLLADREPIEGFEFQRELSLGNLVLYAKEKQMRTDDTETGELTQEYTSKHESKFHQPVQAPSNSRFARIQFFGRNNYNDSTNH